MIDVIFGNLTTAFEALIDFIGVFLVGLFGDPHNEVMGVLDPILPLIFIPIAIAVVFFSVKIIKKVSWGY